MKNIIQLKSKTGEDIYPVNNSNSVKIVSENKNLTTKLQEFDSSINNVQSNILDLVSDIENINEKASSALSTANRIDSEGRFVINGNVSNFPDEEDITIENLEENVGQLKLKDRVAENGHRGYVILREDIPLSQQLTQENTTYEVRYNFDLGGLEEEEVVLSNRSDFTSSSKTYVCFYSDALNVNSSEGVVKKDLDAFGVVSNFNPSTLNNQNYLSSVDPTNIDYNYITSKQFRLVTICSPEKVSGLSTFTTKLLRGSKIEIPANCTLKFVGGKFSNGILIGNNTNIEANSSDYIFDNVSVQGSYVCSGYVDWFGAKCLSDTTSILGNSTKIQKALDSRFGVVKFNKGYYYVDETLHINHQIDIQLEGSDSKRIIPPRKKSGEGYYGDKPNIIGTIVWSDKNISILNISIGSPIWTIDENISFSIKGGCFDVSKVSNYSEAVLDLCTGLATYCYPHINTTLYGPIRSEVPFNLCSGYGIRFQDQSIGSAFYDGRIVCTIFGFYTAVKHENNDYNSSGTYITSIIYDCAINNCVCAYDFGTAANGGGKILGTIQAEHLCPTQNNGECLIKGNLHNLYINPFVWDIQTRSSKTNIVFQNEYNTLYNQFTDYTTDSSGNIVFNSYFPEYICNISGQNKDYQTAIGQHILSYQRDCIKGYNDVLLKHSEDITVTNKYHHPEEDAYLGVLDNFLYNYYKRGFATIDTENCYISDVDKPKVFLFQGGYVQNYDTSSKITVSINNIYSNSNLSASTYGGLTKLFITYTKGFIDSKNRDRYNTPIFGSIKLYQFNKDGYLMDSSGHLLGDNSDYNTHYQDTNVPEVGYYWTVNGEVHTPHESSTYIEIGPMEIASQTNQDGVIKTQEIYETVDKVVLVFSDLNGSSSDSKFVTYFKLGIEGSTKRRSNDKVIKALINTCVEKEDLPVSIYNNSVDKLTLYSYYMSTKDQNNYVDKYYPMIMENDFLNSATVPKKSGTPIITTLGHPLTDSEIETSQNPNIISPNSTGGLYRHLGTALADYSNYFITTDGHAVQNNQFVNEINTFENKPNIQDLWKGYRFWCTDLHKPLYVDGGKSNSGWKWREADGAIAGVKRNGLFTEKPNSTDIYTGFQYFVTTTNTPIWFNGTTWVKYDGSEYSEEQN